MSRSSSRDLIRDLKPAAVLTLICLVAGTFLSITYDRTAEKIVEAEQAKINYALSEIFPSANFVEENGYYKALENEELVGYAAIVEGKGYGGTIKIAIGVCLDGTIKHVRIISQDETPGLGSRITEDEFLNQFDNKSLDELKLSKEGGKIDAITGATISSEAVVNIVRGEFQELIKVLEEGQK